MAEPTQIFIVEEVLPGRGPVLGEEIDEDYAVRFVGLRGDVLVRGHKRYAVARRIAQRAGAAPPSSPGYDTLYHELTPSLERGRSRRVTGARTLPHQHPLGRERGKAPGHVFIDHPGREQTPLRRRPAYRRQRWP